MHRLSCAKRKRIQQLAEKKERKKKSSAATDGDKQTHVGRHGNQDAPQPSTSGISLPVEDVSTS